MCWLYHSCPWRAHVVKLRILERMRAMFTLITRYLAQTPLHAYSDLLGLIWVSSNLQIHVKKVKQLGVLHDAMHFLVIACSKALSCQLFSCNPCGKFNPTCFFFHFKDPNNFPCFASFIADHSIHRTHECQKAKRSQQRLPLHTSAVILRLRFEAHS